MAKNGRVRQWDMAIKRGFGGAVTQSCTNPTSVAATEPIFCLHLPIMASLCTSPVSPHVLEMDTLSTYWPVIRVGLPYTNCSDSHQIVRNSGKNNFAVIYGYENSKK